MAPIFGFSWRELFLARRRPGQRWAPKSQTYRATYIPRLDVLEDRCLLSVLTVTNNHESGPGSLRAIIKAAHAGDTIKFSSSLTGTTIALNTELMISKALDIEGPGAGGLSISGKGVTRIFDVRPAASSVTIAGLTLKKGLSDQGGAILDNGTSLTLRSDTFDGDRAVGSAGNDGLGGALMVQAGATAGMAVTIRNCSFANDVARGGHGGDNNGFDSEGGWGKGGAIYVDAGASAAFALSVTGTSFTTDKAMGGHGQDGNASLGRSATDGGQAQGGAVWLFADVAGQPYFYFSTDTFASCDAIGGQGGAGATDSNGGNGGNGGDALGGVLYYIGSFSAAPSLSVNGCAFTSNSVTASVGGAGGDATDTNFGFAGNGGNGGAGRGGAILADFENSVAGSVTITGSSVVSNGASGENGGAGGVGVIAGNGGNGGEATGGGIDVRISGAAAGSQLSITASTIIDNGIESGSGGLGGGDGDAAYGGAGGDGGDTFGGGIDLWKPTTGQDTWILDSDNVSYNLVFAGYGGAGGNAVFQGGNGGDSGPAAGGGVADLFDGTLEIFHAVISSNQVFGGVGGIGGDGGNGIVGGPGMNGVSFSTIGGGIAITPGGTALATADTQIVNNTADFASDVYGTLGTI